MDPDAVGDGECGQLKDACIRWGWWLLKGRGSFEGEFGRPIVTNEDFVA